MGGTSSPVSDWTWINSSRFTGGGGGGGIPGYPGGGGGCHAPGMPGSGGGGGPWWWRWPRRPSQRKRRRSLSCESESLCGEGGERDACLGWAPGGPGRWRWRPPEGWGGNGGGGGPGGGGYGPNWKPGTACCHKGAPLRTAVRMPSTTSRFAPPISAKEAITFAMLSANCMAVPA